MPEDPETPTPSVTAAITPDEGGADAAVAPGPSVVQQIEAEVDAKLASIHAEVEAFWANVVRNTMAEVPTTVHNYISSEKEALKARIAKLF